MNVYVSRPLSVIDSIILTNDVSHVVRYIWDTLRCGMPIPCGVHAPLGFIVIMLTKLAPNTTIVTDGPDFVVCATGNFLQSIGPQSRIQGPVPPIIMVELPILAYYQGLAVVNGGHIKTQTNIIEAFYVLAFSVNLVVWSNAPQELSKLVKSHE